MGPRGAQEGPSCAQETASWSQEVPSWAQETPSWAQEPPSWASSCAQEVPSWPQEASTQARGAKKQLLDAFGRICEALAKALTSVWTRKIRCFVEVVRSRDELHHERKDLRKITKIGSSGHPKSTQVALGGQFGGPSGVQVALGVRLGAPSWAQEALKRPGRAAQVGVQGPTWPS